MQVRMRLFFTDAAPAEIYTLSLHDALPISFAQRRSELDDRGMRKDSAQLLISVQSLLHLISRFRTKNFTVSRTTVSSAAGISFNGCLASKPWFTPSINRKVLAPFDSECRCSASELGTVSSAVPCTINQGILIFAAAASMLSLVFPCSSTSS